MTIARRQSNCSFNDPLSAGLEGVSGQRRRSKWRVRPSGCPALPDLPYLRCLKRRPSRSIQNGMMLLEMNLFTLALHARAGGNCAVADDQNSSDDQGFRLFPCRVEEKRCELYSSAATLASESPLLAKMSFSVHGACRYFFKEKLDKVELSEWKI
jgi:hypothetical protein